MEAFIGFAIIAAAIGVVFTRITRDGRIVARWNQSSDFDGITGASTFTR